MASQNLLTLSLLSYGYGIKELILKLIYNFCVLRTICKFPTRNFLHCFLYSKEENLQMFCLHACLAIIRDGPKSAELRFCYLMIIELESLHYSASIFFRVLITIWEKN